jgi:hypothetical protein
MYIRKTSKGQEKFSKVFVCWSDVYTDKKEKKIFLIYIKIQMGAVAKSYMRMGFLIFAEMRTYLVIYEEALVIYDFATTSF